MALSSSLCMPQTILLKVRNNTEACFRLSHAPEELRRVLAAGGRILWQSSVKCQVLTISYILVRARKLLRTFDSVRGVRLASLLLQ